MTTVTLYGKPGCHICEDARHEVLILQRERGFELEEFDVSADPALHAEYGERIPVVAVDGVELFELGLDTGALERALDNVKPL
jgi:glutaredoxin